MCNKFLTGLRFNLSKYQEIRAFVKNFFYIFLILIFAGCQSGIPGNVKLVLSKAGKNRKQLYDVIKHYKKTGERQKLKAAYFLIGNMEDKYGVYYPKDYFYFKILSEVDSIKRTGACEYLVDNLVKKELAKYKGTNQEKQLRAIPDMDMITSDFLIDDIDHSFHVWKTKPWASYLSFKEFCEWILPYRVKNEPLQYWRKFMYEKLKPLEDSMKDPNDPREMCQLINEYIADDYQFTYTLGSMPILGGLDMWKTKAGVCDHRYTLITMAMRSMGVASGIDFTFQYPDFPGGHEWTVLLDRDHKIKPYNGGEKHLRFFIPAACPIGNTVATKVSTVYRHLYAKNLNSIVNKLPANEIPENFRNQYIADVTDQYTGMNKQNLTLEVHEKSKSGYAFLYTFSAGTNVVAVSFAKVKNKRVMFKNVGKGGIYFLGYYNNNKITMDGYPFILPLKSDKIEPIVMQPNSFEPLTLYRKYPVQYTMDEFINDAKGAKIQGANKKDFSDSVTLYTINSSINYDKKFNLTPVKAFRYYRYICDTSDIRIADLAFFYRNRQHENIEMKGHVYGYLSGEDDCYAANFDNAFDDNIATNLNAPKGSWVAMDAGKPVKICAFRLLVRNNLNVVEPGDTYELFYLDNSWKPLGKKLATDYFIKYDTVPKGALLLLRDLTKGKEERVFSYTGNQQDF